ncbi:MAG: SLC13 family permease [Streptosporangiaceae bacterium]|jgi:arsenical pump membrane protein
MKSVPPQQSETITTGDDQNRPVQNTPRLGALDWIAIILLVAGGICVGTGLLPTSDADDIMRRIWPILLFLATVLVLAELTAQAGLFNVIAARLARSAGGKFAALFGLCVVFASVTTITLNLDTTAVLLTPVMLALAVSLDVPPLPLAMTTTWLANTASLLLPVSNLTNLLAANRVALAPVEFASRMWLAQAGSIAATGLFLWLFYWNRRSRGGAARYVPPPPFRAPDAVLLRVAALACVSFIGAILGGVPLQVASAIAMVVLLVAFAIRRRRELRWSLIPWRLPVFVTGLFLVMQTISLHLLNPVLSTLIGTSGGADGTFRAAAVGAGLANIVNNLPAYLSGEAVVPLANHTQLLGLLIGTNIGPIITPWASLATLLCYERCRSAGVRVPMRTFVLTGAGLAVTGLAVSVAALLITG